MSIKTRIAVLALAALAVTGAMASTTTKAEAYPINWGWVDIADVAETLAARPGHQHVVITGRKADPRLIDIADLVTEMKKVKHPMDAGQKGQRGIEW